LQNEARSETISETESRVTIGPRKATHRYIANAMISTYTEFLVRTAEKQGCRRSTEKRIVVPGAC
jgi:hypothetical protein